MCRANPYVQWGMYISGTQHQLKLKFSIQTNLAHKNTTFEYCHGLMNLGYVDVLFLENENVCRPVLKNITATMLFQSKQKVFCLLPVPPTLMHQLHVLGPKYCLYSVMFHKNTLV